MSIRSYFGSRFGGEGSFLSARFLGGALAAVAGFGSAGAMLQNADPDQVNRWNSIPQDDRYYTLEDRKYLPRLADKKLDRWPNLAGGRGHWKTCMEASAGSVIALLRAFGVEPFCSICKGNQGGSFDTHTLSPKHFQAMCDLVEQTDDLNTVQELLWHETYIPGGRVKYNHLDGELQVLRDVPMPEALVVRPQDLSVSGQWVLVCAAAVVAAWPGGNRNTWPNMWGLWHWKQKMDRVVERVVSILSLNSALKFCPLCVICPDE